MTDPIIRGRFFKSLVPHFRGLAALALLASPISTPAQSSAGRGTIQGITVDSSGAIVSGVEVQLGDVGIEAQLTRSGEYRFDSIAAGFHTLIARKLGFQAVKLQFEVLADDITYADIVMRPAIAALAPVTVAAESSVPLFTPTGFMERAATGRGTYFTESDIAKIRPERVSDLMRRVPGLTVFPSGEIFSGRGVVTLKTQACAFGIPIFVDNVQVGGGSMGDPESITDQEMGRKPDFLSPTSTSRSTIDGLKPKDIAGIEIYKGPGTAPPQVSGTTSSCGAILIWTK
jgi:Carboxypeptidase regulatory-like domain